MKSKIKILKKIMREDGWIAPGDTLILRVLHWILIRVIIIMILGILKAFINWLFKNNNITFMKI